MPENAGANSLSVDSSVSLTDLKRFSTVFPIPVANFPGMDLVPHLGQI